MQLVEFETSFGLVIASEQSLVDALKELVAQRDQDDPVEVAG